MTARTGAVTSETKVVEESALMVEETAVGEAMASTSLSTWGLRSGLYMVAVRATPVFLAWVATYRASERQRKRKGGRDAQQRACKT